MAMMSNNIFLKILSHEIPAKIAYQDDLCLAFYDIHPQAPVHVLVIPKDHIENAMAVEAGHAGIVAEMLKLAQETAKKEGVDRSGFRLVFNNGPDAGQAVSHLHLHLLGKRKLKWPPG